MESADDFILDCALDVVEDLDLADDPRDVRNAHIVPCSDGRERERWIEDVFNSHGEERLGRRLPRQPARRRHPLVALTPSEASKDSLYKVKGSFKKRGAELAQEGKSDTVSVRAPLSRASPSSREPCLQA